MTDDGDFLRRWSRRKLASKTGETLESNPSPAQAVVPVETGTQPTPAAGRAPTAGVVPESSGTQLPPVESLTVDSDFTPFMQPGVDPALKRQALRTLLRDPRFNVMDGLDVYIDDFSKPDPIPADWLGKLNQMAHLGDRWPQKLKDEAQAAALRDGAVVENPVVEQPVASSDPASPADTSASGSTPSELKQS